MTVANTSKDAFDAVPAGPNAEYVECWNDVLTPKWVRFRHLLSGNGQVHSDLAYPSLDVRAGQRALDVACGFGENTLELAERVGKSGSALGIDCTRAFVEIARREARVAGAHNVAYQLGDIERAELAPHSFDVAVSRFGIMYCASPVRALRAIGRALVPGGRLGLIAWRRIADNQCWELAERIALRHLPRPGAEAQTCGPGPFSMADRETNLRILAAAGFEHASATRLDAELCVGRTLEEAIEYQMMVGPAGYVIREAGERGARALPRIRGELEQALRAHQRSDGSVWLGSSTWFLHARTPRA